MFEIKKLRLDQTVDFAAEELKKYLRKMMPEKGDIKISYDPKAQDGFRLGLLEDFGLPNEAPDPFFDDVVHIDTDEKGGVLAGSNPRSVLFAVYRFFRLNGCRWLFPGPDGEDIPHKDVEPQKYHKLADTRYRGHTTEGDPSFGHILDYIDFFSKQELNFYGLYSLYTYHRRYYDHRFNEMNRPPEPITPELAEQWKGRFETELLKRGAMLADGTHDFMLMALGLKPEDRYPIREGKKEITEEQRQFLAMLGGVRAPYKNNDLSFTQACMSNPEWRQAYVKAAADFMEARPYVAHFGASLADGHHNHCECPECRKGNPSDFLVTLLNELDEELTRRGVKARVSISTYNDQMLPPRWAKAKNPARFQLSFPPHTRSYSSSLTENDPIPEPLPYVRNKWKKPKTMAECVSYLKAWQKQTGLSARTYEYHFWRLQTHDPALMAISRRIYEDMLSLKIADQEGIMEDGSNRHYFPHGFHCHIYAETLVNRDLDYEAEKEDYFSHLYGKDRKEVLACLNAVSAVFDIGYMEGEESEDPSKGKYYAPSRAKAFEELREVAAKERALAASHPEAPTRSQTVAYRLLDRHAEYVEGIAGVFREKCLGHDKIALEKFRAFLASFGKREFELDRYFDFGLVAWCLEAPVRALPPVE
jgi:hypothetical protein